MSTRHEKLAKKQLELAEDIFTHKSHIANIELQVGRKDPIDTDREWLAKANYALSMKRAELGKLETQLATLELSQMVIDSTDEDESLLNEFVAAAKRRLDPEVVDDLMTEAREIIEDRMYGVVEYVQPLDNVSSGNV